MSFTSSSCHIGNSLVNPKVAKVAILDNDYLTHSKYNVSMSTTEHPRFHLATWRRKKGFTQEQLGNILGVGKSAISRWESGKRHMSLDDLEAIAKVFEIGMFALFFAPNDYPKAKTIHDFSILIDRIGIDKAHDIMQLVQSLQK